jgi:hypothetical protein
LGLNCNGRLFYDYTNQFGQKVFLNMLVPAKYREHSAWGRNPRCGATQNGRLNRQPAFF